MSSNVPYALASSKKIERHSQVEIIDGIPTLVISIVVTPFPKKEPIGEITPSLSPDLILNSLSRPSRMTFDTSYNHDPVGWACYLALTGRELNSTQQTLVDALTRSQMVDAVFDSYDSVVKSAVMNCVCAEIVQSPRYQTWRVKQSKFA